MVAEVKKITFVQLPQPALSEKTIYKSRKPHNGAMHAQLNGNWWSISYKLFMAV